jgi:hypothetical protein
MQPSLLLFTWHHATTPPHITSTTRQPPTDLRIALDFSLDLLIYIHLHISCRFFHHHGHCVAQGAPQSLPASPRSLRNAPEEKPAARHDLLGRVGEEAKSGERWVVGVEDDLGHGVNGSKATAAFDEDAHELHSSTCSMLDSSISPAALAGCARRCARR